MLFHWQARDESGNLDAIYLSRSAFFECQASALAYQLSLANTQPVHPPS